jgi:hypothetical protein
LNRATAVASAGVLQHWEATLADPHQVISVIATAICDCRKDRSEQALDPEEAKQIAKCIVTALADAGLKIVSPREEE